MLRSTRLYLEDIVRSCAKVLRYTQGMTFEEFLADEKTYDAVIRNLQVLGEATKQIPQELRENYPSIEWRKIAGLRDIVAHAYFQIKDEIIWDVVTNKLKLLHQQVQQVVRSEFNEE